MPWKLHDYLDAHGVNDFKRWSEAQETKLIAKLNQRLDMLEAHGLALLPSILSSTRSRHIYKLKIKGKVQLRPMLCRGPFDNNGEFTLLMGASEKDMELVPRDADHQAEGRRQTVLSDTKRRCNHERVSKKA